MRCLLWQVHGLCPAGGCAALAAAGRGCSCGSREPARHGAPVGACRGVRVCKCTSKSKGLQDFPWHFAISSHSLGMVCYFTYSNYLLLYSLAFGKWFAFAAECTDSAAEFSKSVVEFPDSAAVSRNLAAAILWGRRRWGRQCGGPYRPVRKNVTRKGTARSVQKPW